MSSSLEPITSNETVYDPPMKPNQLNTISMQSLHTQKNGSIATQAHIPSEPKTIKSQNIETKITETKFSANCSFEDKLRSIADTKYCPTLRNDQRFRQDQRFRK